MKHVVFVLGSYYPNYSAVGKCLGNIADVLENDFKISIVSLETAYNQKREENYHKQNIMRISTKYNSQRIYNDEKIKNEKGLKKIIYQIQKIFLRVQGVLRKIFSKYTINKMLVKAYVNALRNITEPIDILIPTCSPLEGTIASILYKEEHFQVKVIPYLFDLFAINKNLNYFKWNTELKKHNNMQIEKWLFDKADTIFYVSNWTSYLKENYLQFNNKMIEVEHPLLVKQDMDFGTFHKKFEKIVHIVYTGILDVKNRNPSFALQVLSNITECDIVVDFYSFGSGNFLIERKSIMYPDKFISHGKVSSNDASRARNNADILLSIGNTDVSQMPSKVFEYMATGKAILHIAENKEDPAIKLLEKYPAKMVIIKGKNYNSKQIADFLVKCKDIQIPFDRVIAEYYNASPSFVANQILNSFEAKEI